MTKPKIPSINETIKKNLSNLYNRDNEIIESLNELSIKTNIIDSMLRLNINENRRFQDESIRRFESIDKKLGEHDKNFESIDKRFEQVDKRFEQVDKRFEQVDKRFDKLEDSILEMRDILIELKNRK